MGKCNVWFIKRSEGASKVKPHFGVMLLVYAALMFLICLPNMLDSFLSERYIQHFTHVSNLYQNFETSMIEKAQGYDPLFPVKDEEIWLSLSEKGSQGSNIRNGPGEDYEILTVISGDEQVLYLNEQNGKWVHIQRSDGTEGWIHQSLVEVPAKPAT